MVLPLHRTGQIRIDNALRVDWLEVCPPVASAILEKYDLGGPTGRLALNDDGHSAAAQNETYICGNPPYVGSRVQDESRKEDLRVLASHRIEKWKSLDYIAGWYLKAADYNLKHEASFAFVSTSSICEGLGVGILWPEILTPNLEIYFAHRSFKWQNLAVRNAAVSVIVAGVSKRKKSRKK